MSINIERAGHSKADGNSTQSLKGMSYISSMVMTVGYTLV